MSLITTLSRGPLAALFVLALGAGPALTADTAGEVDPDLMDRGERLYDADCAICHQRTGTGVGEAFPALAGNEKLEDAELIIGNIHNGRGAMVAFPDLDAGDLAALASYIRNSWGNDFGGVSEEQAAVILASVSDVEQGETTSIWDGVYTEEQAARGEPIVMGACAKCHGTRYNGAGDPDQPPSPPIARGSFLFHWDGESALSLSTYIHAQMPLDNPGQLDDQEVADVIASMLQVSGAPAGDTELSTDPDALERIILSMPPED